MPGRSSKDLAIPRRVGPSTDKRFLDSLLGRALCLCSLARDLSGRDAGVFGWALGSSGGDSRKGDDESGGEG